MKSYLLFFLALVCGSLQAQSIERSVVALAGQADTGPDIRLEWTLGEIAVQTLPTRFGLLTEGFHQPTLSVSPLTVEAQDYRVDIFPNPVRQELSVRLPAEAKGTVDLVLRTVEGREMLRWRDISATARPRLDVSAIPRGIYLLSLNFSDGTLPQSFRIVKAE